jgi:hypothetical protein
MALKCYTTSDTEECWRRIGCHDDTCMRLQPIIIRFSLDYILTWAISDTGHLEGTTSFKLYLRKTFCKSEFDTFDSFVFDDFVLKKRFVVNGVKFWKLALPTNAMNFKDSTLDRPFHHFYNRQNDSLNDRKALEKWIFGYWVGATSIWHENIWFPFMPLRRIGFCMFT